MEKIYKYFIPRPERGAKACFSGIISVEHQESATAEQIRADVEKEVREDMGANTPDLSAMTFEVLG